MANNKNTNTPPQLFVAVEVAERHLLFDKTCYNSKGEEFYGKVLWDSGNLRFICEHEDDYLVHITHVLEPITPSTDTIEQEADNFIQDSIKQRFPEGFEHNTIYLYDEWIKRIAEFATSPAAVAYWLGKNTEQLPEISDEMINGVAERCGIGLHEKNGIILGAKWYREELRKRQPQNDGWISVEQIRKAIANYMGSEGCSCCRLVDRHEINKNHLAELLKVEKYEDGSGFDFTKYETK